MRTYFFVGLLPLVSGILNVLDQTEINIFDMLASNRWSERGQGEDPGRYAAHTGSPSNDALDWPRFGPLPIYS